MAPRTTVSDAEIIAAGRKLAAAGTEIVPWALQRVAGGGNPDRLMAVWRAHVAAETPPAPPVLPLQPAAQEAGAGVLAALTAALEVAIRSVWDAADQAAKDRLDGLVADARREADKANGELEVAAETLSDAYAARDAAVEDARVLNAQLAEALAEQNVWRGRAEAAELQVKLAGEVVERAAVEHGRLLQRIEAAELEAGRKQDRARKSRPARGSITVEKAR